MATIRGRVIDKRTGLDIQGARVVLGSQSGRTDSNGNFSIEFNGDNPPNTIKVLAPKYAPKKQSAVDQQGNLLPKVNVFQMTPLVPDFGITLPAIIVFGRIQLRSLRDRFSGGAEGKLVEGLMGETTKIYQRLIPFALKQLSRFGIQDPADLADKSCPPITEIQTAISEKNKTTRQLNNSFKSISSASNQLNILEALVTAFQIVRRLLGANPTPTAIGLPPGPAGGILPPPLTKTMGQTTSYDSKREKIDRLLDRFKNVSSVLPDSTIPLSIALSEALDLLNATDTAIGDCLNDIRKGVIEELNKDTVVTGSISGSDVGIGVGRNGEGLSGGGIDGNDLAGSGVTTFDFQSVDENRLRELVGLPDGSTIDVQDLLAGNYLQEQLDSELLALTEASAADGSEVPGEYKGFLLSVETESEEASQGLSIKRRFAVAKNRDGVTLLQGEKSYSSNDQVLIDELIFRIDSEDLKPA